MRLRRATQFKRGVYSPRGRKQMTLGDKLMIPKQQTLSGMFTPGQGKTGAMGYLSAFQGLKGVSQLDDLQQAKIDLAGAGVESQEALLEAAAIQPELSRLGLDKVIKDAEESETEDASTLATLIDSGMSPEEASEAIAKNREQRDAAVTTALSQNDQLQNRMNAQSTAAMQNQLANLEAAKLARKAQETVGQLESDITQDFEYGTQFSNLEGLLNPQAGITNTGGGGGAVVNRDGNKMRGFKHGGVTPGPHDHDVLNLVISHEDGSPALDADGDEMHVTGSEAIIPDYIFDQLMGAARAGDKNALYEIFMDEIATEQRFQG
tara:strand:- start:20927 stop:21889 length:963 start_codon:yes stop_codon:yes gene_type:complete